MPEDRDGGRHPERDRAIRRALLAWYATHRRDLPWRDATDPYAVWVSEIMLQQTRVGTVGPYFARWMERFPNVASLAAAPLEAVLEQWQGLGYYSRARHLHRAARTVMADGGDLPTTREGWRALPGVGAYTAGAVASIAFGEPVAAVDGNVKRVLARLFAIDGDPRRAAFVRAVEARAEALAASVPAMGGAPGDWTQALMELGATVCTPRVPRCGDCPVAPWCAALASDRVAELPRPTRRAKPRPARVWALVVERGDGRLLVARRPDAGLLGGLWELPLTPVDEVEDAGLVDPRTVGRRALGLPPERIAACGLLPSVEHVFTHLRLRVDPLSLELADGDGDGDGGVVPTSLPAGDTEAARHAGLPPSYAEQRWVARDAIQALPTSVLMDKLLAVYDGARSST